MIDLDYFERYRSSRSEEQLHAILAELRAAREVVEAARLHECSGSYQRTVWAAIVAYDQAVAP